jgi:hypothetical protein
MNSIRDTDQEASRHVLLHTSSSLHLDCMGIVICVDHLVWTNAWTLTLKIGYSPDKMGHSPDKIGHSPDKNYEQVQTKLPLQ